MKKRNRAFWIWLVLLAAILLLGLFLIIDSPNLTPMPLTEAFVYLEGLPA